jgi:MoaA/NifB/PqqE/SkfB family radical SAM enzyme
MTSKKRSRQILPNRFEKRANSEFMRNSGIRRWWSIRRRKYLRFAKKFYYAFYFFGKKAFRNSETFCMAPWIQLHAQTNGLAAPCCMSATDETNYLADLNQNPDLKASWNSERMKQLRLNMLNGKKSSICSHCYKYESLGFKSERQKYNRDYLEFFDRVLDTQPDGSLTGKTPLLLDMRFSNKCNYKCRICDSSYSSLWYEDEQKLGKKPQLPSEKRMKISADYQEFKKSFLASLDEVVKIHFAGGEPLVMDEHYEALEYMAQKGLSHVLISYNTNFSTLKYRHYKVIDLWNQFDRVDVWASLDGMGARGDYMRKGQRWQTIEENIRTVKMECPGVLFGVNVTVNALNVFHLPEFIQHMIDQKLVNADRINLYMLFDPAYFNLTQLPPDVKEKAKVKLEAFSKGYLSQIRNGTHLKEHIQSVIHYMMESQGERLPEMIHWLKKVDELRGENFGATFPELAALLENKDSIIASST